MLKICIINTGRLKRICRFIFFILFSLLLISCGDKTKTTKSLTVNEKPKEVDEDSLYSLIMTGDVMMGTNYPSEYSLPPDDGKYLFDDVKDYLQSADVTIGNLEGTLLNSGGTPKVCIDPEHCVSFRMPQHYAEYLKDSGFDIMSVANNHSGDMGDIGRKSTVKTLDHYGIKYAGYETCPTTIFIKDGIKFGFTSFAPNDGTQNIYDTKSAVKVVTNLKKQCDILIVAFHGGGEGTGYQHINREREYFLGEDRGNVYSFAHSVIDAGADIVFGQGPHVARAIELYKNKIIAYSLGNFCTYGKFGLSGVLGLAPVFKVYIDKKGDFMQGRIFPCKQVKHGFPVIDDTYSIVSVMQKLTSQDFPETNLIIYDDGKIEKSSVIEP